MRSIAKTIEEALRGFRTRFGYFNLIGAERERFEHQENWIRSFAHSLLEQTGNELIGENEPVDVKEGQDFSYVITQTRYIRARNILRVDQRTKLTQLLTALEKGEK
jgi:hypothetical protein